MLTSSRTITDSWITFYILYTCLRVIYLYISFSLTPFSVKGADNLGVDANGNTSDFTTKLLHLAWHPTENSIACAASVFTCIMHEADPTKLEIILLEISLQILP